MSFPKPPVEGPPRDLVGYGVLQLIAHIPLVYLLCWLFARSVPYVPPTP